MSENKTRKYLKYAIGEIVLVVIGIMIALNINNRNEDKKTLDQVNTIVGRVLNELVDNIDETTALFRIEDEIDSILNLYLTDKWKEQYLQGLDTGITPIDIFNETGNHFSISLTQNSYNQLVNNVDNLPSAYMDFYDELVGLYETSKRKLWEEQDIIFEIEKEIFNRRSKLDFWRDRRTTDEGLDIKLLEEYVLEDLDFKSHAYRWYSAIAKQRRFAGYFRTQAIKCYNMILSTMEMKDTTNRIWNIKGDYMGLIEGKYVSRFKDTFSIKYKNKHLVIGSGENGVSVHRYDSLKFAFEENYLKFKVSKDSVNAYIHTFPDGQPIATKIQLDD
jgi:hypothetical protein